MPGFFESNGYSASQRQALIFTLCIAMVMSFVYASKNDDVWWNRNLHAFIMLCISLCCFILLYSNTFDNKILLALLISDIVVGIYYYYTRRFLLRERTLLRA